jgi:hypothetical protein
LQNLSSFPSFRTRIFATDPLPATSTAFGELTKIRTDRGKGPFTELTT